MQRFVNDPDYIVEDMVKGYVKAHKDLIKRSEANDRVVQYVNCLLYTSPSPRDRG